MKIKLIILALGFFLSLQARDIISVSIDPLAFFLKQISSNTLEINTLVAKNANEHHLELKPATIKALEHSKIYFTLRLEFEEELIKKIKTNYKTVKIIDLSKGLKDLKLGKDLDPHIWLDPKKVKIIAARMQAALIASFPDKKELFKQNLASFDDRLTKLDKNIKAILKNSKTKIFISYHPSWGYFAKRYELTQIGIEKHGKEAKLKDLLALISLIKEKHIKTIFIQDGFDTKVLASIQKECKLKIVKLNHLEYDYISMLENAARKIAKS